MLKIKIKRIQESQIKNSSDSCDGANNLIIRKCCHLPNLLTADAALISDLFRGAFQYKGCHLTREENSIEDTRDDSRFAPSQWVTALLCNDISHWLGASLESGLGDKTTMNYMISTLVLIDLKSLYWNGSLQPVMKIVLIWRLFSFIVFMDNVTVTPKMCLINPN